MDEYLAETTRFEGGWHGTRNVKINWMAGWMEREKTHKVVLDGKRKNTQKNVTVYE
jgi:hypothetical protein